MSCIKYVQRHSKDTTISVRPVRGSSQKAQCWTSATPQIVPPAGSLLEPNQMVPDGTASDRRRSNGRRQEWPLTDERLLSCSGRRPLIFSHVWPLNIDIPSATRKNGLSRFLHVYRRSKQESKQASKKRIFCKWMDSQRKKVYKCAHLGR